MTPATSRRAVLVLLLLATGAAAVDRFRIESDPQDQAVAATLRPVLEAGMRRIEAFFDRPFELEFVVQILPSRAAFDAFFREHVGGGENSQPWMVASADAKRLVMLSPRVWKTEAAEHDPADAAHVGELVAHELVHTYHAQHNPRPTFEGMDEMGWFVEGLAVLVSGQLDGKHKTAARDAIAAGKAPASLVDAWSGRYRYGVCGSMAQFVDVRWGRDTLKKLLAATSNDEVMKILGTSEPEFLKAWNEHVAAQK